MQRFDEPPALTNGRVIPMLGRSMRHIPILITTCAPIMNAVPKQIRLPVIFLDILPTETIL